MSTNKSNISVLSTAISVVFLASSSATFAHTAHTDGLQAEKNNAAVSAFDIVHTKITTQGNTATFHIAVSGQAGTVKPTPTGKLAGSDVFSYVWPTTLNSAEVGFEKDAGILAFAVTSHPDFDDTPLYDENGDGDKANDGDVWHSHWVVLHPNEQCGPGALGVVDIPEGAKPKLPATWPELPLLIDSPDYTPNFDGESLNVEVKVEDIDALKQANFDGVTAGLRVNASAHSPLLCVKDVFDVASGNLSLPGVVNQ